jgi:uridine phosphorylase
VNLTTEQWLEAMDLAAGDVPELLILEGTWWEDQAYEARLAHLDDVRMLAFPGMAWGRYRGRPVVYCCAYGAARAVEPVHALGAVGTRRVVQIGSCGGLQDHVATGDVVLPQRAVIGEGASQYYGGAGMAVAEPELLDQAARRLEARGMTVHRGLHLTTSSLFMQPADAIARWRETGYLGVDMETSAVFSAARRMGMRAVSMVFVWDELLRGRTWLDPFPEEETRRQRDANAATFAVALDLLEAP